MTQQTLVSISEASRILGVSEATLRQWTDEGRVKAFITPGGHRRYSTTDLNKFMSSGHKVLGIKDLVTELEETAQLHRELVRKSLGDTSWYRTLSAESQVYLAEQGRSLLNLIIRYVTEPSKREEIVQLVREDGYRLGETLASQGLTLTDSVESFVLHRDPIMNATTQLMRKREAYSGRVLEAVPLVNHILDQALVSLIAAHQHHQNEAAKDSGGGIFF